jgi:molybdopterin-guanine dinucleotide biosynthesis protein A
MSVIVGVILAGGLSRRMGGGDKCLMPFGSTTLLDIAIERARPQVDTLVLSANGDPSRFENRGLPVEADVVAGHAGPLAGILTGMDWCEKACPNADWVLSVASDTPFFPQDLASRLLEQAQSEGATVSIAESGSRLHPVFGLWHRSLAEDLREALVERDVRKMQFWLKQHPWTRVCFDVEGAPDPFFNINSQEDLAIARGRVD